MNLYAVTPWRCVIRSSVLKGKTTVDIRGNFARDFRPDRPAWVNYTNNFLADDQLLTACLQDNNSLSTAVVLLIWEDWLQVGEQFGRGGSPMDGNPGKLLMREWDPFSLRALPRREDGPELSTLDAEFPTVFFSHFSAAICCQMLQLFFLVLFHYAI